MLEDEPDPALLRGIRVTSRPLMVIDPVSGSSRPAMARSSVDLPEPLGPSSAVSEPVGTTKSTLSRAVKLP